MRPTRGEPFHERQEKCHIAQVSLDGLRHPWILDLHGHLVAVERGGAVHLADRGGGERLLVEVAEHASERAAELLTHQLLEIREPHWRDVVAKRGEAALQIIPLVLREPVELDHRDDLADLHRGAAHLPKLVDELLDKCGRPLAFGRRSTLSRPNSVGGTHSRPPQALTRHQPSHPSRPRKPTGRQLARLRRIVSASTHSSSLATSQRLDSKRPGHPRCDSESSSSGGPLFQALLGQCIDSPPRRKG